MYDIFEFVKYFNKIKNMFLILNFLMDIRCSLFLNFMKFKFELVFEDNLNDIKFKLL